MKNKNTKYSHSGRPRYGIKWPKGREFTKKQICEVNDIDMRRKINGKLNPNWGKGPLCTLLTINKGVARDLAKRGHSVLIRLKETAEPDSKSGLGRHANLYALRSKGVTSHVPAVKPSSTPNAVKAPRKARTPKSTSQTPTADTLDKIHDILAQPSTPTPALTVPAVTIAPEAPAPAPAPVAVEAPAPVAEAAPAPAPVAESVATLANS